MKDFFGIDFFGLRKKSDTSENVTSPITIPEFLSNQSPQTLEDTLEKIDFSNLRNGLHKEIAESYIRESFGEKPNVIDLVDELGDSKTESRYFEELRKGNRFCFAPETYKHGTITTLNSRLLQSSENRGLITSETVFGINYHIDKDSKVLLTPTNYLSIPDSQREYA